VNKDNLATTILVFGASGYIGGAVTKALLNDGYMVIAVSRTPINFGHKNLREFTMDFSSFNFENIDGVDIVIYCAGIAHNKYKEENLSYANIDLPNVIAKRTAGKVSKFIFLSSATVMGNKISNIYNAQTIPNPKCLKAIIKNEAERVLTKTFEESSSALTIVRCPMVYGKDAPGNFSKLAKLVHYPLPFKYNETCRAMLYISNLVDVFLKLVSYRENLPAVIMPSDSSILKMNRLLELIANSQGRPSRLFHINKTLLTFILKLIRRDEVNQLFTTNFIIDSTLHDSSFIWKARWNHEQAIKDYFS
jgi:nucleoside-diphosphate-sugar epimerase